MSRRGLQTANLVGRDVGAEHARRGPEAREAFEAAAADAATFELGDHLSKLGDLKAQRIRTVLLPGATVALTVEVGSEAEDAAREEEGVVARDRAREERTLEEGGEARARAVAVLVGATDGGSRRVAREGEGVGREVVTRGVKNLLKLGFSLIASMRTLGEVRTTTQQLRSFSRFVQIKVWNKEAIRVIRVRTHVQCMRPEHVE